MPKAVPIENNHQISVIATSVLGIVLATTFVALRLIAKRMGSGFDYSDYCVLAALVFNTAIHVDSILMVVYGGFGLHLNDIFFRFGPDTAMFFFKGVFAYPILWNIIVCFSKLSILFMYLTLIPNRSMLLWVRGLSAFFILWAIGNILGAFFLCRPLSKNWDFTPPRKCGSIVDYYSSMSIINIVTDVILIILPMPYLYKLRLALHKKIIAMAMLSIGIGTWVISIYRQTILKDLNVLDFTYSGVLVTLLSGLEPSVALALACVPLLRPLARSRRLKGTAGSQYGSSGGSQTLSRVGGKRTDGRHFDQLNDDSSEVELQPVDRIRDNRFRSPSAGKHSKQTITVEKRIEITSDVER